MLGSQALFHCSSISRLPLPAHKFNFPRPLCTSKAWRLEGNPERGGGSEERKRVSEPRAAAPTPCPSCPLFLSITNSGGSSCWTCRLLRPQGGG